MDRRASTASRAAVLAAVLAGAGCGDRHDMRPAIPAPPPPPRSVVVFIGDGMGPQQVGLLLDWADAAGKAPTEYARLADRGVLGLLRTGAHGTPLTDSAAGATALASGVETRNGAIGVDAEGHAVRTCLEAARGAGRATGLVTTTTITHATPAAFAAHVPNRADEKEIGVQLVASGTDVLLGGGARFVDAAAARAAGYTVVTSPAELAAARGSPSKLLGLFSDGHVPYAIDRDAPGEPEAPSLAAMTEAALDVLGRDPDGFFLMVEGGRIDHACHLNDVAAALGEMREFDDALGVAARFQASHPEVLVLVTADHETGGLSVTSGAVPLLPRHFLDMASEARSVEALAPPASEREKIDPSVFGVGRRQFYPPYSWWETSRALDRDVQWNVSFATQGHTTTPVPIVAVGPHAERFAGLHANESVGVALCEWMALAPGRTAPEEAR